MCQFSSVSNISPDPGNKSFYSHGFSFCMTSSNNIKCIHDIIIEVSEMELKKYGIIMHLDLQQMLKNNYIVSIFLRSLGVIDQNFGTI